MATQNIYALTDTWNNVATTFTAIKMNVTDTASAATSMLIDLQVDGTTQFHVLKSGAVHTKRSNYNITNTNAAAILVNNYSLTGSDATSMFDLAGTWNTSGTPAAIKLNMTDTASNAASLLLDLQVGGSTKFHVDKLGGWKSNSQCDLNGNTIVRVGSISLGSSNDALIGRNAAASLRLGAADAASPVAQTLGAQGSRAGTDSNVGGANLTIRPGNGTGTGTISTLILQSPVAVGSGTGAQTQTTGLIIKAGTAVMTSYTVATLPAAATAGAGARAFVTDALAPVFGSAVAGSGAVGVPVYSTGAAWNVG
jgi:hypothetical protein